jgi:hypothetical protein
VNKKDASKTPQNFAPRSLETATEDTAPILFQAAALD